eukprot:TRINITY_DN22590_c0_g1_i1.p1 TRINITY_DN22590_c0_g1~~TRINITY_DN22590_c0_g1_i1.p1  ORF type:complete len:482 (+),score=113.26 TRINITY_DN22590_c0_g1_i1:60-1505(+)
MPKILHIQVCAMDGASAQFSVNLHCWRSCYADCIYPEIQKQLGVPIAEQSLILKESGQIVCNDDWDSDLQDTFLDIVAGFDDALEEASLELSLVRRSAEVAKWLEDVKLKSFACDMDELNAAPEDVRSSRDIFLAAAKRRNIQCFQYATEDLKADAEFVRALISASKRGEVLFHAAESIKSNRDIMLFALSHTGEILAKLSKAFKSDEEIVLSAVKGSNGSAMEFASELLRSDRQFVMKAVKMGGHALGYVSEELQNDKEIVLEAVRSEGAALGWVAFGDDKEVVLAAVSQNGEALDSACDSLKADREVVRTAVLNHGGAMQYASTSLRNDKDFAFSMVMQGDALVMRHVGKAVTEDKSCMTQIVCKGEQCDPDEMKGEPHFVPLEFASLELQADKELVLKAVWHNGYNLAFASEDLKADREVALHAMRSPVGWRIWDIISPSLHKDKVFALEVVKLEDRVKDEFLEFFSEDELLQVLSSK